MLVFEVCVLGGRIGFFCLLFRDIIWSVWKSIDYFVFFFNILLFLEMLNCFLESLESIY